MVSDKPPRRSRSEKTPVTIDLAADQAKPIADPISHNGTDPVETPPIESVTDAPATDRVAEEPKPEPAFVSPFATASAASESAREDMPETVTPTGSEPPSPPMDEPLRETTASAPQPQPQPQPQPKGTSGSALAASGILGGLVALLLAGSMQYAGYLPGLNNQAPATSSAALDELRQQVAQLRNAPKAAGSPDLTARIEALEAKAGNGVPSDLEQRLVALQAELASLKSSTEGAAAGTSQLTERLGALETEVNQPGAEQAVARALAAAALKAATERGGSFAAELQTFAQVAPNDPAVEALKAYADRGVPTRVDLARRLPAATNAIFDALNKPDPNQGIAARLMASALSVVKVRPVGDVAGDTPEAMVARFEERVKTGDLKAAIGEWNALPEAARQASADFRQALNARIEVEDLMNGTLTRAMTSAGSNG